MPSSISRLLTFKPYGDQLLDGMAEIWLIFARLNVASIALCDAVAWGYFAYTTSLGTAAYAAGILTGLLVFTLVASLDATFVMHDRSRRQEKETEPPFPEAQQGGFGWIRRNIHRDHVALAARIVLVILTFTVTAPFLTQLIFTRDIEANIRHRNEQVIASRREEIGAAADRRVNELRLRIASRQADLEKEIAGSGASGRYGKGVTARAIESEVSHLREELRNAAQTKTTDLQQFDRAAASPELLASRYGVDLVREGPATRARAIEELERSPAFRATQLTIKAFLLFMFLGLVCLKLFQPESVRIYYSARLQAAWRRMQAGIFDHRLDPRERASAAGMSPVRFAEWYENDQQVHDATDRLRDQTARAIESLRAQEDAVRVIQETLRGDIATMDEQLAASNKTSEDLEQQVLALQHDLNVLNARIAEEQQVLDDFRYDLGEDLSLRDQQLLISSRNTTVRRLAEHRAAAAGLTATLARLTSRLESSRAIEAQLRQSLHAAGNEVAALGRRLQQSRRKKLTDIVDAG